MNKIVPRYYQTAAKDAFFNFVTSGKKGNPLICMPTASGKAIVIADIIIDVFRYFPGKRVMMITHTWKLIDQNNDKLRQMWPSAPVGIHSDGLGRRDTMLPIIFGGVKSIYSTIKKDNRAFGSIDLIIVDEAHLISDDEKSEYLKLLQIIYKESPQVIVLGLTATFYRMKMGLLTEGPIFDEIIYNICDRESFQRLITEGYLNPLIGKPTNTKIDGIRDVNMQAGEFNQSLADKLVDRPEIIEASCKEVLEFGWNRQKMMGFASGINSAEHLAEMFQRLGAPVTCVHSGLSQKINKARLEGFSAGEYWGVIGANMLTTGYDEPQIDMICDWQVTNSTNRHVQKLGRGTRVLLNWEKYRNEPKANTLVLDFVGNIGNIGPIDDPRMPRKPGMKTGEPPPIKICDAVKLKVNEGLLRDDPNYKDGCGAYNHASVRNCCNCAEEFSFKIHVEATAFNDSPMKVVEAPVIERFEINRAIYYSKHEGKSNSLGTNNPPTIKAIYPFGIRSINKFICFEHTGRARHLAHEWWMKHSPNPPPATCDEFLSRTHELRTPKSIQVHVNLKWPEIVALEF